MTSQDTTEGLDDWDVAIDGVLHKLKSTMKIRKKARRKFSSSTHDVGWYQVI